MAEEFGDVSQPIAIVPDQVSDGGDSFGVSSLEGNLSASLESLEHSQNVIVKKDVHLVLAGRSGVGKTTLASSIFGLERERRLSARHITQMCDTKNVTKHGITLNITDTVGTGRKSALQKLARHTKKHRNVDLLVYCISVDPSSKFHDGNPTIMRSLSDAYGKDIWKHCIVIFTFSNCAWEWCKKNITEQAIEEGGKITKEERRVATYKELMKEYADDFTAELKKLRVPHTNVKEIFDLQPELQPDQTTIVAIPAGEEPNDPVLPATKISIQDRNEPRNRLEVEICDWRDVLFIEIVRKCNNELKKRLLQYHYGADIAKIVAGTAGGAVGGLVAGATVGAVIGIVGGPIGVGIGAVIGGVAGGTTGIASGGSLSEQIIKD